MTEAERQEERKEARREKASLVAKVAMIVALVALIPSIAGLWLVGQYVDRNSTAIERIDDLTTKLLNQQHQTARQQRETTKLRAQAAAAARAADLQTCRYVNRIIRRDRKTIQSGVTDAVPVLRALDFTDRQIAKYLDGARKRADREVKARPLIAGGNCLKLPNATKFAPKPNPAG